MHYAMSKIRASCVLGDITFPENFPCPPVTSLWVGVLCSFDVALDVSVVSGVFRTARAADYAACTLAWMFSFSAALFFL